jgi:hypothetical protein
MVTSESTTQPIICCIGEDVAGRPTQFVLERAFDAERMHWQALSVEVRVEKLSLICEAMLAMGFRGLRFYDKLEREAGQHLTKPGSLERFVGNVTSALNVSDDWQVWDHRGPAWLNTLTLNTLTQGSPRFEPTAIWINGDELPPRSLFAALMLQPAESKRWVWTEAPSELNSLEHPRVRSAIADGRILFAESLPIAERLQELLGCSPIDSSDSDAPRAQLALITSADSLPSSIAEIVPHWSVQLAVPDKLKLPTSLAELVIHRISEADIAIAAEAYDFFRWTNRTTDIGILRDAYDEYCDF